MSDGTTTEVARGRRHIIKRPRLTRLLDETSARIIMLVAPAGYGKTTLAREWLSTGGRRASWYFGGPASADVAALASGLAVAAARVVPGAGTRLTEFLLATSAPEEQPEVIASLLVEDIADWPGDAWLAIDDAHFAEDRSASEALLDALTRAEKLQVMLTTRRRPSWGTRRRVLYGEIAELGPDALVMTDSEVVELLGGEAKDHASSLIALTGGWPAAIALASLHPRRAAPLSEVAPALHDFFAEELYRSASTDAQRALLLLALLGQVDHEAEGLLGSNSACVLAEVERLGFLTMSGDSQHFELHPLLRQFLRRKVVSHVLQDDLLGIAGDFELATKAWDDAFTLVEEFQLFQLLDRLLEASLDELLREARYSTLAGWVAYGLSQNCDSPMLDLTEAELALRRGQLANAETLALRARDALPEHSRRLSRALIVAGRATHLASDERKALSYFEAAVRLAIDPVDRADAAWARYVCACELELDESRDLLAAFERMRTPSLDDEIRLQTGLRFLETYEDDSTHTGLDPESVLALAARVRNPMVRSSFVNRHVWTLMMLGRYDDAAQVVDEHLRHVRAARLDFALAHALLLKAGAETGRRRFDLAETALDDGCSRGEFLNDAFVAMNGAVVRGRLEISRGRFAHAAALTSLPWRGFVPSPGLRGEYLAVHALALACQGETDGPLKLAVDVDAMTKEVEARTLAACVRAVVDLNRGSTVSVASAFELVRRRGNFDSLVTAYRGEPRILTTLAEQLEHHQILASVIERAHDLHLARKLGLPFEQSPSDLQKLTRRENEVLRFVREGKTNKEIATILFLSEATVKVHVRHILEKLGVRTRTQAAIRAIAEN